MAETTILTGGRRTGRTYAMAQMTKRVLAEGKVVMLWGGGEFHKVVGVVDNPSTKLIEQDKVSSNAKP
jgi:hypothetical protein